MVLSCRVRTLPASNGADPERRRSSALTGAAARRAPHSRTTPQHVPRREHGWIATTRSQSSRVVRRDDRLVGSIIPPTGRCRSPRRRDQPSSGPPVPEAAAARSALAANPENTATCPSRRQRQRPHRRGPVYRDATGQAPMCWRLLRRPCGQDGAASASRDRGRRAERCSAPQPPVDLAPSS
jgi:hypothetical protein